MKIVSIGLIAASLVVMSCKNKESTQPQGDKAGGPTTAGDASPGPDANAARTPAKTQPPGDAAARAKELAQRYIILDGHVDLPYRLYSEKQKTGKIDYDAVIDGSKEGNFDYPRAHAGGLDAPFMSIYVPAKFQKSGGAKKVADGLIDMVETLVSKAPDKLALGRSVAEVRANQAAGKISLPMGIENGAAIEGKLANLKHFYDRGVRYITLTHSENNDICDSSYDKTRKWKGLSPFGKEVVAEMNRLGIMIDVAHISDDTFYQVIELSKTPVIASHSSARHFLPGFERDMSDDMIQKLAANGGVILINFGSGFLKDESRKESDERWATARQLAEKHKLEPGSAKLEELMKEYDKKHTFTRADVTDVANHIDHVVELVGVDHVGFGSDFEGVGDSLPAGLEDVSMYPNLIRVLLERGYSDVDIEKIASGNALRVWQAVEDHAAKQAAQ